MQSTWGFLLGYIRSYWEIVALHVLLIVACMVLSVVVVPKGLARFLATGNLGLLGCALVLTVALFAAENHSRGYIQANFLRTSRDSLFERAVVPGEDLYTNPNPAQLLQAYTWLPVDMHDVLHVVIHDSAYVGITLAVTFVNFAMASWVVAVPTAVSTGLYAAVTYGFWTTLKHRAVEKERDWYSTTEFVDSCLHNLLNVYTSNEVQLTLDTVAERNRHQRNKLMALGEAGLACTSATLLVSAACLLLTLYLAKVRIADPEKRAAVCTTALTVFTYLLYQWELLGPKLADKLGECEHSFQCLPPPRKPPPRALRSDLAALLPEITVAGVTFSYGPDRFEYPPHTFAAGKITAVTGPSGCGKSTLLKLLVKCWPPHAGAIEFGGVAVADLDTRAYRRQFSYMNQNTVLWDGTVRENILRSAPAEGEATLLRLLDVYNITIFDNLPAGLDTHITLSGSKLSGGQQKMVRLLRALLTEARVYLLDEPLTSLDPIHCTAVCCMIRDYLLHRTVILVTHTTDILPYCDCTYSLKVPNAQ